MSERGGRGGQQQGGGNGRGGGRGRGRGQQGQGGGQPGRGGQQVGGPGVPAQGRVDPQVGGDARQIPAQPAWGGIGMVAASSEDFPALGELSLGPPGMPAFARSAPQPAAVQPVAAPAASAVTKAPPAAEPAAPRGPPAKKKEKVAPTPGVPQEINLAKREETMRIKEECHGNGMVPPEKRKTGKFPGTLKNGVRECKLEANHFPLRKLNIKTIFMYNIKIEAPWKRPYSKRDNELYREIFHKWVKICPQARKHQNPKLDFNPCFAFNGNNVFYSTKKIDGRVEDIEGITMPGDTKELSFNVREVFWVQNIEVNRDLESFMNQGRKLFATELGHPQDALTALEIILQQCIRLNNNFRVVGRSYFHTQGQVLDVGFGKEVWIGTFTSMRPFGWKDASGLKYLMTMNADVANKPATKSLHLTKESKPGAWDSYIHQVLHKNQRLDFNRGLQDKDLGDLDRDLRGLKVRYELPNGNKRCYKVNKVVQCPKQMMIPDLKKTVEQYFKEEHKTSLQYPLMPCLHLGSMAKTIYIPVEFCAMEKQPLPRGKKLPDDAVAHMIRGTATKPNIRREKILEGLARNSEIYKHDPWAQEFGISFEAQMAKINGRILPPPSIEYKKVSANAPNDNTNTVNIRPQKPGSWDARNKHYVNGTTLTNWAILDLAGLRDDEYNNVVAAFGRIGREVGINIETAPDNLWHQKCDWKSGNLQITADFETIVAEYKKSNMKLELIMVIFPFKGGAMYDLIKNLGDLIHKVPTQCVLKNTMFKGGSVNFQVVSNICLKINSKLGGINHILAPCSKPAYFAPGPFMVMGADVSHAAPESKGDKPSIAAVVGSMNPTGSKYECEIRVQNSEQNEEIIQDMKDITRKLLLKFLRQSKYKPNRIIMFRDGVSEGQFLKVLAYEVMAMRDACASLEQGYNPQITYLVVQKRHHTRFFACDNNKYEKNLNVLAGTVVDQGLNHPTEGDFYLVSHEGIQGTSRPTHYQVLWDDADMHADELERLTYYLCHLYSRCTRSVSYPSPTYYSHLAADRARKHHNDMSDKHMMPREIKERLEMGDINIMYFV